MPFPSAARLRYRSHCPLRRRFELKTYDRSGNLFGCQCGKQPGILTEPEPVEGLRRQFGPEHLSSCKTGRHPARRIRRIPANFTTIGAVQTTIRSCILVAITHDSGLPGALRRQLGWNPYDRGGRNPPTSTGYDGSTIQLQHTVHSASAQICRKPTTRAR
jgi:hypothetical protein